MSAEFKVLINYTHNDVAISQSIYSGPHRKHAEKAYTTACTLARHGVLTNCTIRFFDGNRLRDDWERTSDALRDEPMHPALVAQKQIRVAYSESGKPLAAY